MSYDFNYSYLIQGNPHSIVANVLEFQSLSIMFAHRKGMNFFPTPTYMFAQSAGAVE